MFYPQGIKVIPQDIYNELDWIVLTHWICGDGTFNSGMVLQTDSFSKEDVARMINI